MVSEQVFALCDVCVGHCVAAKTAFAGLNADVDKRILGSAFDITVATGGNTYNRAFCDIKDVIIDLKAALAREDDVIFFIFLVAVEKRNCSPGG